MGANDTPATTRSVVTEYFDWRLNNQTTTNSRLSLIVRRVANECETAFHAQQIIQAYGFSFSLNDVEALNNVRAIHREIAREIFSDDRISWGRILTVISFSAILAEFIIQHPLNHLPPDLIKSSLIDWTTNFIDTEFHEWLEGENYWVRIINKKKTIFSIETLFYSLKDRLFKTLR